MAFCLSQSSSGPKQEGLSEETGRERQCGVVRSALKKPSRHMQAWVLTQLCLSAPVIWGELPLVSPLPLRIPLPPLNWTAA